MSYYASNYYASNFYNNNYYVGTGGGGVVFTTDNYFDKLGELGYTGTLADRQMNYLLDLGFSGGNSRRKRDRLLALGYSGGSVSKMLKEKTDAEGFITVSEMMVKTGLIPV